MDNGTPLAECEVCGGTDFYKESGHFYCNECQTQSQQVQEHVFEQEDATINKKATRKIHQEKSQKSEDLLTSWECYNYVLKGLTQELVELGAKPELTAVVRCLWMKYLHKCEVFDINSDRPPKISVLGSKKDIAILYNVKRRKRRRSRTSSTSTTLSVRRHRSNKKRALINSQYEELSQSQSLTQDSSVAKDTLSTLKSGSETSEGSGKICFNKYSSSELNRAMSPNHRKQHEEDIAGEMTCHRSQEKSFRPKFVKGPTNLTPFTLYSILYIGLLIVKDSVQLGDLLRFMREGHLSFGCYRHFFDEDISEKTLNLPQRKEMLFTHGFFRRRCISLVWFLDVAKYIEKPDLMGLCSRYCSELNLPKAVFECCEKLILKTAPKMALKKGARIFPNYEGRAMSFVLFALKLIFGLDGVTEKKLSNYARILNDSNPRVKMFNFLDWLQFIGYREAVINLHHLPTALRNSDEVDSDMYLNYLENQDIKFKGSSRTIHNEVKDHLHILDKLLDSSHHESGGGVVFEPSLTPFTSYTRLILDNIRGTGRKALTESFADHSIEFLLRPKKYLEMVGNPVIKNGGANDNIITEDILHMYRNTTLAQKQGKKNVNVKISKDISKDKFIKEYLDSNKKESLRTTDVKVLLSNWQKGNKNEFLINADLLKVASESVEVDPYSKTSKEDYKQHFNAFERYWLNIPTNPLARYFPKQDVENVLAKFPYNFKIVLRECARIVEQDFGDFFPEFLVTEMYLVYLGEYGCKNKKDKSKGIAALRKALASCDEHW